MLAVIEIKGIIKTLADKNGNQLTELLPILMLLILEKVRGLKHQKNDKSGGMLHRYERAVDNLLEFIDFTEFLQIIVFHPH